MDRQTCATPEMRCILSRSEVLEDVLGLEDVLEYTIWSPWARKSSPWPWPRSLQVLKNALSWAREQHYFLTCWKWAKVMTNFASSWWTPESLQKTLWRHFFLWRALEFFWTFFLFFFGRRRNFSENLRTVGAKTFSFYLFFMENTSTLCLWCLASSIPDLGLERVCPRKGCSWPRIIFVSLALASSLVFSTPPLILSTSDLNIYKGLCSHLRGSFWKAYRKMH